jgi:hypothetical protein
MCRIPEAPAKNGATKKTLHEMANPDSSSKEGDNLPRTIIFNPEDTLTFYADHSADQGKDREPCKAGNINICKLVNSPAYVSDNNLDKQDGCLSFQKFNCANDSCEMCMYNDENTHTRFDEVTMPQHVNLYWECCDYQTSSNDVKASCCGNQNRGDNKCDTGEGPPWGHHFCWGCGADDGYSYGWPMKCTPDPPDPEAFCTNSFNGMYNRANVVGLIAELEAGYTCNACGEDMRCDYDGPWCLDDSNHCTNVGAIPASDKDPDHSNYCCKSGKCFTNEDLCKSGGQSTCPPHSQVCGVSPCRTTKGCGPEPGCCYGSCVDACSDPPGPSSSPSSSPPPPFPKNWLKYGLMGLGVLVAFFLLTSLGRKSDIGSS